MPLVKVKGKYQVTLPTSIRDEVGISVGDLLEATVTKGTITLTPKILIDRGIAEGLEDMRKGRSIGPFATVSAAVKALHKAAKRSNR